MDIVNPTVLNAKFWFCNAYYRRYTRRPAANSFLLWLCSLIF